ncbi:hypothetical protein IFM89_008212 [Coptis chinensis]|uniref:15-cis-phytoene synthase n=1 Tax=Coptis chinensis TaxID=261450 RepID=A0A835GYD4_9MAGN|nr:hypothetical protein IFM89_008212 [Coptis chinensis]
MKDSWTVPESRPTYLQEAYERCTHTFPARDKNIYQAWCRRTDDLVDEPNAIDVGVDVLDRWEERLQDIFNGRPHDILDAALTDTVYKFPIDIKPFKDLIDGMRMDITKCRYENFEELYQYCYHVAVAPGLMVVPSVELQPEPLRKLYDTVLYVCIAVQITNILRDVKEE